MSTEGADVRRRAITVRGGHETTSASGRQWSFLVLVVGLLVPAACGSDDPSIGADGRIGSANEVHADAPTPEAATAVRGWPAPGRDLRGNRAVPDSPIDSKTIGSLEAAWSVPLPGPGIYGNAASGPVVVGDTVLVQDLSSTVRAIDLRSGKVRWTAEYDLLSIGPNGPAVGYGLVFFAKGTKQIAAVDLETGVERWSVELTRTPTEGIDIQPQVFGGLVYVSTVPISLEGQYQGGDAGVLYALDAETGKVRWDFRTVKGDDLWGNPDVNSGGGAWYPPAIDEDSGTIYWGIANPAPYAGTPEFPNGSSRPGDNLYTDSVVALDAATGQLRWYHQAVPHDLFDRDLVHVQLVATGGGSEGRDVLVGTGKLGRVIGHDPETGEVLWDTKVGLHRNDDLTEIDGPTEVLPGSYGGVLTPPSAADGVVYVPVVNSPSTYEPDRANYIGAELGQMPGEVDAVDAATGEVLWTTEVDGDPLGGTIVLGDLVLTALLDGKIIALDRATGKQVWTHQAPGGINGWPAASGDTLLWPVGQADPPVLMALRLPKAG
ncbi:PQQ-binding-like beta-propeller repeat protein [soil metagenome]